MLQFYSVIINNHTCSQSENFGINSRLQWRFSGLSNLFLVFNDNYLVQDELIPRMRSFNLKLVLEKTYEWILGEVMSGSNINKFSRS